MFYDASKRIIDAVGSFVALIILSPFFFLIALAIKLDSRGPVFYIQERVTQKGMLFRIIKFRTMKLEYSTGLNYGGQNADQFLQDILADPKNKAEFQKFYKLTNDPRVTRVGKWLRKTSFDEAPQFWNVLIGTMSLVGPRAYLPKELLTQMEVYPQIKPDVKKLLTVKPGITGPWQIGGRSNINFDFRVKMDAGYAQKRSVLYDLQVLLRTPFAVITARGAV
jgi:lipopolysaccharide/colanic/teichoic acid biosynthesis glycosyltransferase